MYLINFFRNLIRKEEGQTLAEYALIIFLIALVAIVALTALGVNVAAQLQNIANNL